MSEDRKTFKLMRSPGFAFVAGAAVASVALVGTAFANQPLMWRAMGALNNARAALMEAEPNKGGHRERAIELVDRAIAEVQAGIEFARR